MLKHLFKLGWKNIWRNKRRTLITLVAIGVGVFTVLFAQSYIAGILDTSSETMIKTRIGHIRIAHREYLRLERILPKEYTVEKFSKLEKEVAKVKGVDLVSGLIQFNVLLSNKDINKAALAIGIDKVKADKIMDLSSTIIQGKYFSENKASLIIGKILAEKLKVKVDDELLLVTSDVNYSTYALAFKIAGIFETGFSNMDAHLLYIPLEKAQEMLDYSDAVHQVLIYLDNKADAVKTSGRVKPIIAGLYQSTDPNQQKNIRVIPWQEDEVVGKFLPLITSVWDIILYIIMFIVALVILNTILMSVMDRYHEIGIMKALGFKNREIAGMILIEAVYMGFLGAFFGSILGGALSLYLEKTGIDFAKMVGKEMWEKIDLPVPFYGKMFYPDFTVDILLTSIIFGIITTLIAVIYPVIKSRKMQPVEAFRTQLKV